MAEFDDLLLERTDTSVKNKHPQMYHVIMLNDNITPMEYVVYVLHEVFNLDFDRAMSTMLNIHLGKEGIVGTYPRSEAYEKIDKVEALNKECGCCLQMNVKKATN